MKKLDLKILEDGHSTGLSVRYGGFLAEGASVCLEHHTHPREVTLSVEGIITDSYLLSRLRVSEPGRNSFADMDEAVEFGAMGIAVMLVNDQKGHKVQRSWKGTGFDFWVGEQEDGYPFEEKLRLEISGDLRGTDPELKTRLNKKLKQTMPSSACGLPAWAVIVEFSHPKTLTGSI